MLRGRCPGNPSWLPAALHFTRSSRALSSREPCPLASPALSPVLFPFAALCGLHPFSALSHLAHHSLAAQEQAFVFLRFALCTLTTPLPATLASLSSSQHLLSLWQWRTRRSLDHLEFTSESWSAQAGIPGVACPFTVNRLARGEELPPTEWQATASRLGHLAR